MERIGIDLTDREIEKVMEVHYSDPTSRSMAETCYRLIIDGADRAINEKISFFRSKLGDAEKAVSEANNKLKAAEEKKDSILREIAVLSEKLS